MRFGVVLSTLVAAALAAPAAIPDSGREPAPAVGSSCTCGTVPTLVYSQCFDKPDGSTVIYLCNASCIWVSTGTGCT